MTPRLLLPATLALAAACADDAQGSRDTSDAGPEIGSALCDPSACGEPPASECDADQITLHSVGAGTCSAAGGCEFPITPRTCDTNRGYCRDGACIDNDDLCDYEWGDSLSIITVFAFGGQADEVDPANGQPIDACCFDLDVDGDLDNRMGEGFLTLKPVLGDINADFAEQITRSRMNIVLDFTGVDDLVDDAHVELVGYETVHDEEPVDNPAIDSGFGHFSLRGRSFHTPGHLPRIGAVGPITDGRFVAERARYSFIFATVGTTVGAFPLRDVRFEADVALGPNGRGLALTDGKIGGVLALADYYGVMNADALESCACRTFAGEGGSEGPIDVANLTCRAPLDADCPETDDLCFALTNPGLCEALVDAFPPDFDLDGDGDLDGADAVTVGVRFEATSAEVGGWYDHCPGALHFP